MTLLKALDNIDTDNLPKSAEDSIAVTEKGFFEDTDIKKGKNHSFASSAFSGMTFIESGSAGDSEKSEATLSAPTASETDAKTVASEDGEKESIIDSFKSGKIGKVLFTKKNAVIVAAMFALCCLLVGGQYITTLGDSGLRDGAEAGDDGQSGIVADAGTADEKADDAYFASAEINRNRARDESLDVLSQVIESEDALQDSKDIALASMAKIASQIEAEANIEALVEAKGFADCVAIVGDNSATVIVGSDGLLANEVAQITEIVCEQTNLGASGIKIIEKASA